MSCRRRDRGWQDHRPAAAVEVLFVVPDDLDPNCRHHGRLQRRERQAGHQAYECAHQQVSACPVPMKRHTPTLERVGRHAPAPIRCLWITYIGSCDGTSAATFGGIASGGTSRPWSNRALAIRSVTVCRTFTRAKRLSSASTTVQGAKEVSVRSSISLTASSYSAHLCRFRQSSSVNFQRLSRFFSRAWNRRNCSWGLMCIQNLMSTMPS